jgi:hypothetical protein
VTHIVAKSSHYKDRFKRWQVLDAAEFARVEQWFAETVSIYHDRFEERVISILEQIRLATGMDVGALEADAKRVKNAPDVEQIGTRISGLAASLP